jgi:hypothetical protein
MGAAVSSNGVSAAFVIKAPAVVCIVWSTTSHAVDMS